MTATTEYIQGCTASLDVKAAMEQLKSDAASVSATQEANIVSDLGHIRTGVIAALTAIDTLAGALNTLATKLNADAGVTDTNYATNNATNNVATSSPAAIATS